MAEAQQLQFEQVTNDNPINFDQLYAWLDRVPLTRPKKSIVLDFCDGVLAAEMVAFYAPNLVEVRNYCPTNSHGQKKINWATFNRKVLSKLKLKLSDDTILQIVELYPGAVEQVLWNIREKLLGLGSAGIPKPEEPSNNAYISSCGGFELDEYEVYDNDTTAPDLPDVAETTNDDAADMIEDVPSGSTTPVTDNQSYYTMAHTGQNFEEPYEYSSTPPNEIYYRGIRMVPLVLVQEKQAELRDQAAANKRLTKRLIHLRTLSVVKDRRIQTLVGAYNTARQSYEHHARKVVDQHLPLPPPKKSLVVKPKLRLEHSILFPYCRSIFSPSMAEKLKNLKMNNVPRMGEESSDSEDKSD